MYFRAVAEKPTTGSSPCLKSLFSPFNGRWYTCADVTGTSQPPPPVYNVRGEDPGAERSGALGAQMYQVRTGRRGRCAASAARRRARKIGRTTHVAFMNKVLDSPNKSRHEDA